MFCFFDMFDLLDFYFSLSFDYCYGVTQVKDLSFFHVFYGYISIYIPSLENLENYLRSFAYTKTNLILKRVIKEKERKEKRGGGM